MDLQQGDDAFTHLFADSNQPQYSTFDSALLSGHEPNFHDASWSLNASPYHHPHPTLSRAQSGVTPGWQNANHLAAPTTHGPANTSATPYSRSLSRSPAPFGQNAFGNYPPQQNLQPYRQQQPQYDPALFNGANTDFTNNFDTFTSQQPSQATIAPQALQHELRQSAINGHGYGGIDYAQAAFNNSRFATAPAVSTVDQQALVAKIPSGTDNGRMISISIDQLARATQTTPVGKFLTKGAEAQEWPVNRTTTLPQYIPRKSKNELRKLVGKDAALLAKIGSKSSKHRTLSQVSQSGQKAAVNGPGSPEERIKHEGDPTSSEELSDEDDESSYTSDDGAEPSPLPLKRPDNPKDAVEYDTIKALWRPKRKPPAAETIRSGIVDFWEIVKTIRDRWKTDTAAVTEAEEKKRMGELPLLQSRVKDQRDMMEAAFKAALKYGHRAVVELLAENHSLVFLCYQFLLDRFKAEDLNGPLSRVILELMTRFTTLNDEVLEKTHLVKVLPRYAKKGDAKTQHFAKRIAANAASVSKQKEGTPPVSKAANGTMTKAASTASPQTKPAAPAPVAGVKRPASAAVEAGTAKKVAIGGVKKPVVSAATKTNGIVKKPITVSAPTAAPVTKTKQVTAKPSTFFSSLQSAAKKPGTSIKSGIPAQAAGTKPVEKKTSASAPASAAPKSTFNFAETIANLGKPKEEKVAAAKPEKEGPVETPEEKEKRLRKEARRKLQVRFKTGDELVQIRFFTHDPEEDLGHDDSQRRDVSDVGGEGRMLKLHQDLMDVDEEDDVPESPEPTLIPWRTPTPVDFSVIDEEERSKNYARFGGMLEPDSPESNVRDEYEAATLMTVYGGPQDIPPSPREPSDPYNGIPIDIKKQIGMPDPSFVARAAQRKAQRVQQHFQPPQPIPLPLPPFDLSSFNQLATNLSQQPPPSASMSVPQAAPSTSPSVDLTKLLASLKQVLPPQPAQPAAPPMMAPPPPQVAPPPQPPQPNSQQIDISAILSAIGGGQQPPVPPPQQPYINFMQVAAASPLTGSATPQDNSLAAARHRDQGDKSRFYKTKVCKYWEDGRCMKGESCTYLHEKAPP